MFDQPLITMLKYVYIKPPHFRAYLQIIAYFKDILAFYLQIALFFSKMLCAVMKDLRYRERNFVFLRFHRKIYMYPLIVVCHIAIYVHGLHKL
jgi:hypothetical protein